MSKKTPEVCKCRERLHPMKKFKHGNTTVHWCSGCDRTRTITEYRIMKDFLAYLKYRDVEADRRGG